MNQYLIAISVGPVQEFIASARKLRDLWYGSYLLSELSKSVARSLWENNCELIFPAPGNEDTLLADSPINVANKILVLTPIDSTPETLVQKAKDAYSAHWKLLCKKALERVPSTYIDQDMFWKQVDDFGEFFAAWSPYDKQNYSTCREKVEEKLSGRKNFRSFNKPAWKGKGKPKSSLDGIRESVVIPSRKGDHRSFMIKEGETLDALGIIKRFGPWTHNTRPCFDNLAQVAVQPYLTGLLAAAREDIEIADIISSLPYGTELYANEEQPPPVNLEIWNGWPETLPPELLHPAVLEEEIGEVRERESDPVWQNFESKLRRLWKKTTEPQPYCALLLGDGDRMGEALNTIEGFELHQQFSRNLDQFSRDVHDTVKAYEGRVIYSGGDDVMAYVPLHQVLDCAQAVNELFSVFMESACQGTGILKTPTFSIGIAVVHQRKPLHDVLSLARRAEKYAKQEGGRNALAIIQDKRSGSELIIQGKWKMQDQFPPLVERLKSYVLAYKNATLSSRLGYQLRALDKTFHKTGPSDISTDLIFNDGLPGTVLAAEAQRIIRHKLPTDQESETDTPLLSLLKGYCRLRPFSDEIIISYQLFKAIKQSRGEWTHGEGGINS